MPGQPYRPQFRKPFVPKPLDESRIRTPHRNEGEMFAQVLALQGGSRMTVLCEDGKERLARIPGRVRKKVWLKNGDYCIIKPWSVEGDAKCDMEYPYSKAAAEALKRKGILKM